ncbi:MAG: hypothetical protein KAX11_04400 [Candidatus Aminicenantes bacterium]|nr:hypothetical protein [Candidatus Aminicenantes bacterium]
MKTRCNGLPYNRLYGIAGITVKVESEQPITGSTFQSKFKLFEINSPGQDVICISHYFSMPERKNISFGETMYQKSPWTIYRSPDSWIFEGFSSDEDKDIQKMIAIFDRDYSHARIYHDGPEVYLKGSLPSLTMFPTDQLFLANVLTTREAFYIHAGGVRLDGQGLLFIGHANAGKSTMVSMLEGSAEVLSDDRMIIRNWPDGFQIHGNWSHGEVPIVSRESAGLRAMFFLEQAIENRIIPLENRHDILKRLLARLIKPYITYQWWNNSLAVVEKLISDVPCYIIEFDKSGRVVELLKRFCAAPDKTFLSGE